VQVHEAGALARWAKSWAPGLSRLATAGVAGTATGFAETYLAILQGKGSGTGWDLAGETRAAAAFLHDVASPVVLDMGANRGQWTTALHRTLRNDLARFYLCEPQRACQPQLAALAVPGATVIAAAVGERPGQATIMATVSGAGSASLFERRDSYFRDTTAHREVVPVTTIDDIVAEHRLARVHLLKLDVEGSEVSALRGARESLAAGRIATVTFEFGSANVYSRTFFRDLWDLLTAAGFRLWRILPGGRLLPIDGYVEELEHFRGVSNYAASLQAPRPAPYRDLWRPASRLGAAHRRGPASSSA
jgi:FkbM family methyltransferase